MIEKNINNLCHVLFLSFNFAKRNIILKDLVKITDNYIELFGLLYKRINSNIPDILNNSELLGLIPESRKVFEYSLNTNELNINQTLNFANEDLIVVEIELINKNPEDYYPTNKDILIYTNYHSKSKLIKRNDISKNNYKDYGTCFLHKVSGGPLLDKKKYFLCGNEINITSVASALSGGSNGPSLLDIKFVASQIPELKGKEFKIVTKSLENDKNEQNHKIKIPLKTMDTKLKITCYPYKGGNYYGKGKFAFDDKNIEKELNTLDELDYIIVDIYKQLFNSENKNKNNKLQLEKYDTLLKIKENSSPFNYYKKIIESKSIDYLAGINSNKKYYIYDNETNPLLKALRYINNNNLEIKNYYTVEELNEDVKSINISNLKGIDALSNFNKSLWNVIKNGLYLYTQKDKEFITQFLNQVAMNIKRQKGSYDILRNLTSDILDILDKKYTQDQEKSDEKDKKVEKKDKIVETNTDIIKNIEDHITNEIKSMYFNNEAALDEICQVNDIPYEKLGNDVKLKSLTSFFITRLQNLLSYNKPQNYNPESRKSIQNNIFLNLSPYVKPLISIIHKIMILNIFEIDYNKEQLPLFKEFLLDNKLSLEALVNDLLNKCRTISMKIYATELYYNYIMKHNDYKSFIHKYLLNDYSIFNSEFKWDFSDEIVKKIINSKYINLIADEKIELLTNVLKSELTKTNITYQIDKLILLTNDISKLFPILLDDKKKLISKNITEILKIIYKCKKLFGNPYFKEFVELFNKLMITITKDITEVIPEIIEHFINEIHILFENTNKNNTVLNKEEELEKKKNMVLVLGYIFKFLPYINLKSTEPKINESILKLLDVLFSVITSSNRKEILDYLTLIIKTIMSNVNEKDFVPDFSKIFEKLGDLYLLSEIQCSNSKYKEQKYKIIFNASTSELDYGFLANALYYFEDKFPTILSRYKNDPEFIKKLESMPIEQIKQFNITELEKDSKFKSENPFVSIEQKLQKVEVEKNKLKEYLPFTSNRAILKNITSTNVNPGISRLKNKKLKTFRMMDKVNKNLIYLYSKLQEELIKKQKDNKINNEKIINELKLDIIYMKRIQHHIKVAEDLGDIACLRGNSVLTGNFNFEQVLYLSKLIHECLNYQIKSPNLSLTNDMPLFNYDDIFLPLPKPEELIEGYTNVIKETSVNFANLTIIKESLYEKLLELNQDKINLNNVCKLDYISDGQIVSTINHLTDIVYYFLNSHEHYYKIFVEQLYNEINDGKNKNDINYNFKKIIGIIYLISGKYTLFKKGQKVLYNGKQAIITNIYLSKNNECEIQLIKENETTKNIETISQKMKVDKNEIITQNIYSTKLIQELNFNSLIEYLLKIYSSPKKSELILNLLLKILYQANKDKLTSIKEENTKALIDILNTKSTFIQCSCINELEKNFAQSLISKYEKEFSKLSQEVLIPRYNINYPTKLTQINKISNQVLPESEYISSLPQVSLNKGLSCLYNAIKFDKIFVDAIINAYRHDNYKGAVAMSTSQIRSHLLNGNLKSAYDDLSTVFENAPLYKNIFEDNYNPNKVTVEKCIIGKIFLCKDKKLKKEKLVILLFCDFINRILLVMTTGPKTQIFWTSYENLVMVHSNYSSLCYLSEDIDKKFKENLEKLNGVYANKILFRLKQPGNLDPNKEMSMAKLINWNENCKDNCIYNELENASGTNIGNILNSSNSGLINLNETSNETMKNIEFKKLILNQWKELNNEIKIFNIDLFNNIKLNSGSLLPLHKLCLNEKENNKYNQLIISFDSDAFLGPQATLRFYSDEEGTNLLYEIQSIKKEKYGLESIIINKPEVYIEYIPGTTIFYLGEWYMHSRDSNLPCIVAFLPNNFNSLMNMTKNLTNNISLVENNILKELIMSIASNCINDNFPIVLQMKLFNLLNNIFNNLTLYLNNNITKYDSLFDGCATIEQKLNAIGLNKNIFDRFNKIFTEKMDNNDKELFFASPYIIELSNCILNIISLFKEPIENTKTNLIEEIKLYSVLTNIIENKPIEEKIYNEIISKMNKYSNEQLKKVLFINNSSNKSIDEIANNLQQYGVIINNIKEDMFLLENNIIGVIIDCFNKEKLSRCNIEEKKVEEKKEENPEEQMWECSTCHELNDKDNESCVFCDAPKVVAPPKKVAKKKEKKKEDEKAINLNNIDECMNILIKKLETEMIIIKNDNSNYNSLLNKLINLHFNNIKDIIEKKNIIKNYFKDESKLKEINSILDLIKDNKLTIEDINKLSTYGIDIYLDIVSNEENKIILGKINNLGKIIFSLQKLNNSISIQQLIEYPCFFRDKDLIKDNNILSSMTIGELRYYLSIISLINESFSTIVPLLRPPEITKLSKHKNDKNESISLPVLITKFRYIISPKIKNSILENIISLTEYDEDLIQIPSFNVERLSDEKNNHNNEQMFKKYIIKTSRKQGGELIFKKMEQTNENNFKNLTEFNQVYEQYLQVEPACFRIKKFDAAHVAFKIKYMNELVQGLSGPYRQFFSDIVNELETSDKINLLIPTQNNVDKKGEFKDKYTINPKSEEYSQFEFLGVLMGICIRTGVYLPINLCSLVWKKIIGEKVNDNDIKIFDEGLFKMIEILSKEDKEINKELITNSFGENISSITLSDGSQKKLSKTYTDEDLISSSKNRNNLILEIKNLRLNESDSQIISIIKGINKIIPLPVLQYFTWEEIERLVCGKKIVDIELLEKNTIISPDLEKKEYLVKWVWEIVKEFSEEERIQFVKFCYAQERLPYTQEEYDQKQIQFTIKFNPKFKKNGLPRSDTCFFFLILPDYSSKEIMKKMISIAIKMDNVGMNGDTDVNDNRRRLDRGLANFGGFDDDNYVDAEEFY